VAPANFVDWRRELRSFATLSAFDAFSPALTGRGEAERLRALGVSGSFFAALGARAARGRTLEAADDRADAEPLAVLTDGLWQRLFGGSDAALGEALVLDGRPHRIVGVMPAGFAPPLHTAIDVFVSSDRGVPRSFPFPGDITAVRDSHVLYVVGRLAPDATRASARAELDALMTRLAETYPDTNTGLGANVVTLHEAVVGDVRPLLLLMQGAVGLMLLIACANVAHLLLGQAASRQDEMATRVALGAAPSRLVRQLLVETVVLAVPGGALGLLGASWCLELLLALAPAGLPRAHEISLSGAALLFNAAATLATALLCGLGPAWHLARRARLTAESNARVAGGAAVRRWQHALVVGELAVAQVLLVGAALLVASFAAAQRVDLGYVPDGRLAADMTLSPDRYLPPHPGRAGDDDPRIDPTRKLQLVDAVLTRMRDTAGVRAASAAFTAPMAGAPNRGVRRDDRPDSPGVGTSADFQVVTPDYFRTLGMTLVRGRAFTAADTAQAPAVAIVNQAFAAEHYGTDDPVGRRIVFGRDRAHEIVAVVADARYRDVERPADPTFYVPMAQNDERWPFLSFTIWSDGDPSRLAPALRAAIHEVDPNLAIARVRTYDEALRSTLAPRRFNTWLVAAFAGVALLLAAVGVFGVMAHAVATRTRELGIRAALGADSRRLARLVLGEGTRLTLVAVIGGAAGGLAMSGLLANLLYGIGPRDLRVMAAVAAAVGLLALLAMWVPVRRATHVDVIGALRDE
jgi:putative ABC transport system permease protein